MREAPRGPIAYFVGNRVAANLLMALVVVVGVVAAMRVPVQTYPSLESRVIEVTVRSPGSSPAEVQEDINRRLENSLLGLKGVERVVATAREGVGTVALELATLANAAEVLTDVQSAVDGIAFFPPLTAEEPEVRIREQDFEIMTLAVSSEQASEHELRLAAEHVRDDLLRIPSISQVSLRATRDREITIELSEEELRRHGLSIAEVVDVVSDDSMNLTFGELRTGSGGVVLHTVSKRSIGAEFEDIPLITATDGTIVSLGDVAEIRDGFVDEEVASTIDGVPAVFVRINGTRDQSITAVAEEVRRWLASYRLPPDVEVAVWSDLARPAVGRIANILQNAVTGAILVFLVLALVFDLRVAVWITLGIPFAFVGSFIFFGAANLTLNTMTIFGFFLMIGLVVDDALVVGESIAAERQRGRNAAEAALIGTRAVVGPISVGALTTVLALVPLLFLEGAFQVATVLFYVALFVILISLLEAVLILPAHLSHGGRWSLWPIRDVQERASAWLERVRERTVAPALAWSIRHLWAPMVGGVLLMLLALVLVRTDAVRVIVYDDASDVGEEIKVDLYLPVGSPFEVTREAAERVAAAAYRVDEQLPGDPLSEISVLVGNTAGLLGDEPNRTHVASVRARLNPRPVRTQWPASIERAWRQAIGELASVERIEFQISLIYVGSSVAYTLQHDDEETLRHAAADLRTSMAEMPGLYEITDSLALGKRHLDIQLTPAGKAAGLTRAAVGQHLRASFLGLEVQRIQRGNEEIRVVVRYPEERRRSLAELEDERIRVPGGDEAPLGGGLPLGDGLPLGGGAPAGDEVPLGVVARLIETREPEELIRIDGRPTVLVSARADAAVITPLQAQEEIGEQVLTELIGRYPGLGISLDQGSRATQRLAQTLLIVVPIVLFAMYAIMATFLRSYWKPLIAAAGIPISAAGAIIGHAILGWDLTGYSIFGIIGVSGVVVNDVLVLLHRYNAIRGGDRKMPAIAAVSAAAINRFRAVLLTSVTTLIGLTPLLYNRSDELLFLVPMVVSIVSGLVFSGLFVLFVLPALVMIVEGFRE